jgi:hypothetical protein
MHISRPIVRHVTGKLQYDSIYCERVCWVTGQLWRKVNDDGALCNAETSTIGDISGKIVVEGASRVEWRQLFIVRWRQHYRDRQEYTQGTLCS